jgi:hypothetical protein
MARIRLPLHEAQRRATLGASDPDRLAPNTLEYHADYAAVGVGEWSKLRTEEFKQRRLALEAEKTHTAKGLRAVLVKEAEASLKLLGEYTRVFVEPIRQAAERRRADIAPAPATRGDPIAQALAELREDNAQARLLAVWLSGNGNAGELVRDSLINGAARERELAYRTLTTLSRTELGRLGLRPAIQGPQRADDQPRTVQQASELDELLESFAKTHAPEQFAEVEELEAAYAEAKLSVAKAERNVRLIAELDEPRDPGQRWDEALVE